MQAIVAVTENWAIGKGGALLFHLKDDLRRFKELTTGHTIIMGRKTLESLPGKKGLPGRRNIVLTRNGGFTAPDVETVSTPLAALFAAGAEDFCIGGAQVYKTLLPSCDRVYVTKIFATAPDADAFFPDLDESDEWEVAEESAVMEENGVKFQYGTYERKEDEDPLQFLQEE